MALYRHIAHPHGPRTMIDENLCCCFMSQFPADVVAAERAKRAASNAQALSDQVPGCRSKRAG